MAPTAKRKYPSAKEEVRRRLSERKKEAKKLLKEKRARLIVKNLPFKVTSEKLKEHFEQFGEVKSVELLRKENGKLKGCGFVQFTLVQKAAKARYHTNGRDFLGRTLDVDFAKAKNKYEREIKVDVKAEVEKEGHMNGIIDIKDEKGDDNVSEENTKVTNSNNTNEEETEKSVRIENSSENDSDNGSEGDGENSETDMDDEIEVNEDVTSNSQKQPHAISNDVTEGKTIFIKNVPFDATNEDLKQCMRQFGPVYYALICKDALTEHSKGTAFVKFVNKEDVDKALSAGTELKLLDNILDCHPALDRNAVNKKVTDVKESKKEPKDSRNLYLVKEGVILAGSSAANGVSAFDMVKRLQIEQYKTQMLRNLNMFVSRNRLVVHNLPSSWDDSKLRTLFHKYAGPGAVIKEARIMRDMKNVDAKGMGKSKDYGFVSFSNHENALTALRNLNNNPRIFSVHKRPIITFSIENKAVIKARQKRLEKSLQNNPISRTFNPENQEKFGRKTGKITRKELKNKKIGKNRNEEETPKYSGVTSKPGVKGKMRSRYKLTVQAKMHHDNLEKEKKKKKNAKKTLAEKRKDFIKQPKQKMNHTNEKEDFSKLVSDYKKKLNVSLGKRSKWYE